MLIIRQYQDSDQATVWELHNLGLNQFEAHAGNGPWDEDLHNVRDCYIDNGGEFLVGVFNNNIVCIGGLRRKSDTSAEIKRMRVHPNYQKRGFGQTILTKLEERAVQLGYKELCLDTTTKQLPAQKLYKRNGYREFRRGEVAGLEVIFFEKKLK